MQRQDLQYRHVAFARLPFRYGMGHFAPVVRPWWLAMLLIWCVAGWGGIVHAQHKTASAEELLTTFGEGLDGAVRAAVFHQGEWYVGGDFDNASGLPVRKVARWDGAQWRPMLSGVNGTVHAMASYEGTLLVAGAFTEAGSQTVNRIARWDGTMWQAMGTGVNGAVRAIAVVGSDVYIAGDFTMAGTASADRVARWNGIQWEGLPGPFNGSVRSLAAWNDNLVVAGEFSTVGGEIANRIALWDGASWSSMGDGFTGTVHALAVDGTRLYAGGDFTSSGATPVHAVAAWSGSQWEALGEGLVGSVRAMSADDGDLVAVGEITASGSLSLEYVAHWDGDEWKNPGGTDVPANTLVVLEDVFYVGGDFQELAGQQVRYFSRGALAAPERPVSLEPVNGATNVSTSPTIRWGTSRASFTYQVQVSETADFGTLVFDGASLDSTQIQVALTKGLTLHYYRIKAFNNIGASEWTDPVQFRTKIMFPTATSPQHEQKGLGSTVTFQWAPVPQAQSYWIEVTNTPTPGSTPILSESGLTQPTFTYSGLSDNVTYYWRLKAENVNSQSDWSPLRQFTVNLPPPVPSLQTPQPNASQVDTLDVLFRWNAVSNAQSYDLQVSRLESFQSADIDLTDLPALSYTADQLESNTVYFWRVRSRNVGGASAWTTARSFRTMAAPPAPVTLLSPNNQAVNVVVSPTLLWTSSSRATSYQIQLSTTSSFQPVAIDQTVPGTTFQAKDLVTSRGYYWRVRAVNETDVSPWSNTYSFTTTGQTPPAQVTGLVPATGVIDQPTSLLLTWEAAEFADTYRVQVSLVPDFASTVIDVATMAPEYAVTNLLPSERYYWRVAGLNGAGEGPWSVVSNFRTVFAVPESPVLLTPADDAVNVPIPVAFAWETVQGAENYELEISTTPAFTPGPATQFVTSTTPGYSFATAATSTPYYWRLRAVNTAGLSEWTETQQFVTVPPVPAKINLIAPAHGEIDRPIPVQLRWAPTSGVVQYRIQLNNSPNFDQDVLLLDITVTNSFHSVPSLNKGIEYYWRVAGINAGGQGAWSDVRSFRTVPEPPLAPVLTSPPSNMEEYITQPLLQWESPSAANRFHLQLSLSSDFNSQLIIDDPSIQQMSFDLRDLTSLPANTIHYWRVMAINSAGSSPWSETRFFRTFPNLPTEPQLINPADGEQMVYMPLAFQWVAAANAQTYEIMVSESATFQDASPKPIDITGYTDVTLIVDNLKSDQQFYWRVRGRNAAGVGPWSDVRTFHTAPQPPSQVVLVAPAHQTNGLKRSQTFVWRKAQRAESYEFQLSDVATFANEVSFAAALTDTVRAVFLPQVNTTYYWRVRARNVSGNGPWSDVATIRTFTYSSQVTATYTVRFPNANQSSYRLVAMPGQSNLPVAFAFEDAGQQGTDWIAYSERGGLDNNPSTLVEIQSNSAENQFVAGRGFWVLSRRDWTVDEAFPAVTLAEDESYSIPLWRGWNIIANPFAVSVPWASVVQANALNADHAIYDFAGNWLDSKDLLPNKGYYFFNRSNAAALKIPYPVAAEPSSSPVASKTAAQQGGHVRLSLWQDASRVASVQLRMAADASNGYDDYDHAAPPQAFAKVGMAFLTEGLHPNVQRFGRIGVPVGQVHGQTLEVAVDDTDYFRFAVETDLPDAWVVRLMDANRGRSYDLRQGEELELQLTAGSHRWKLWAGERMAVDALEEAEIPEQFRLFDAYPNPFNPTTTFDFALPEPGEVTLRVFDVVGRLVGTQHRGLLQAGYHSLRWDASRAASGVYLIELSAGNKKAFTKVTLVK